MNDNVAGLRGFLRSLSESRANYWASYVCDFTCIPLFAWLGLRSTTRPSLALAVFTCGVASFTLAEYAIHRWLLHNPKSPLYGLHDAHHKAPESTSAFFFPASLVILSAVWFVFTRGLHWTSAPFFICGFAVGYLYFGMLHHFEHTTRINHIPFRWLQHRWAAHSVHHRRDQMNFGVTTSFWDALFGTKHTKRSRSV
jgi:sterol desaturase/sphingolipid hydroxylase (fatty acid hydroxylase superfamily)